MTWVSLQMARAIWPDAPAQDDLLDRLLTAAQEQAEAYAPAVPEGFPIPSRYAEAVVLQARELWSAARRDGDVLGFDSYAVRVRPLSSTVKSLLRPSRGVPRVR